MLHWFSCDFPKGKHSLFNFLKRYLPKKIKNVVNEKNYKFFFESIDC